jgi:hypothetical protein
MEKIMSKTNNTLNLDHCALADSELDAVSGGGADFGPFEFTKPVDTVGVGDIGGDGGGGIGPAKTAWNKCLGVFGY